MDQDTDAALRRCSTDAASRVSNMASTKSTKRSETSGCRRSRLAKHSLRAYRMFTCMPTGTPSMAVRCACCRYHRPSQTIRAVGAVMSISSISASQAAVCCCRYERRKRDIDSERAVRVISSSGPRTTDCGYVHLSLPAYLLTWLPACALRYGTVRVDERVCWCLSRAP